METNYEMLSVGDYKLKDLHENLLYMMIKFHEFCVNYNLKYVLSYGTLLGAVRHKGFIPWDDDVDICMPRKDFMKMEKIMKKNCPKDFIYESPYSIKKYPYEFAKIKLKGTKFPEPFLGKFANHPGLWLDIFPIDNSTRRLNPLIVKIKFFLSAIKWTKMKIPFKTHHPKLFKFLSKICPYWFLHFLIQVNIRFLNIFPTKNVEELAHPDSGATTHPKATYNNLILADFEGYNFYIPSNYDYILKDIYGDYMKLPPESERKLHHFNNTDVVLIENILDRLNDSAI